MASATTDLCGVCCKGSHPARNRICESIVCACGAPFFSQIVLEDNLPSKIHPNRRCRMEIPMAFVEDHGHKFDKIVVMQNTEHWPRICRVTIAGNIFVGFGFEWGAFVEANDVGIGQLVVFTVVARDRFLVQVYEVGRDYPIPVREGEAPIEDGEPGDDGSRNTIAWTGLTWAYG